MLRNLAAVAMVLCCAGGVPAQDAPDRVTVVAFGDSTTAPRGALTIYAGILEKELRAKGVNAAVLNAGVGGNTTDMARRRLKTDVLDHKPAVAIIQFGINDSAVDVWRNPPATGPRVTLDAYRANLEYFVDTLSAAGAKIVLMTPNPMRWTGLLRERYGKPPYRSDDVDGFNVLLKTYAEAVRQVAREKKTALVDVYAAYEAFGARDGQSVDALLLDGMHPNEKGHRIVADLLIARIPSMLGKP